jgi:hypothetical protein
MNRRGDDGSEMPRQDPFDDAAIDRLLSGQAGEEMGDVASFVGDARTAAEAVPTPSHALASALATGILPVPAEAPQSLWRKYKMKIKAFVASLGVAGKIALGIGVAAAATTGAGAAGVLPGPVQHVVASAVDNVTPFEMPDPGKHDGGGSDVSEPPVETTTTPTTEHHEVTPTTEKHETPTTQHETPTTEAPPTTEPFIAPPTTEFHETPTTVHETPTTEAPPTTEHHDESTTTTVPHGSVTFTSFSCTYDAGATYKISCEWTTEGRKDGDVLRLYHGGTYVNPSISPFPYSPPNPCDGKYYMVDTSHDVVYGTSAEVTPTYC